MQVAQPEGKEISSEFLVKFFDYNYIGTVYSFFNYINTISSLRSINYVTPELQC